MAFADLARVEETLREVKSPALLAIFVGARATRRKIEFFSEKDVSRLVDVAIRCAGAFVDNNLLLVHELQNVHVCKGKCPRTRTNLVRASLEVSWGQFIFVDAPGYPKRRLIIPSEDLIAEFFSGNRSARSERSIEIPLENGSSSCFPFHKYDDGWGGIPRSIAKGN